MAVNALVEAVILAAKVLEEGRGHGIVLVACALKVAQEAAGCDISAEASGLLLVVRQTQMTQRPGNERWCGERLVPALVYCLKAEEKKHMYNKMQGTWGGRASPRPSFQFPTPMLSLLLMKRTVTPRMPICVDKSHVLLANIRKNLPH